MRNNTKWFSFLLILSLCGETSLSATQMAAHAAGHAGRRAASETPPALANSRIAEVEFVKRAQALAAEGKVDEAVALLNDKIKSETDREKRGLIRLSLALILVKAGRDADAEPQFKSALEDGIKISAYAHFQLGLLLKRAGRWKEAEDSFNKAADGKSPSATQNDARFELASVMFNEKSWKAASNQYGILKKTMRNSPRYPEVLFNLMLSEHKLGRRTNSCKWARELYAKYPTSVLIKSWGLQLEKNPIDGEVIGCSASEGDMKTRIRRLQLGGEADRALAELKDLRSRAGGEDNYSIDSMIANHLISEGSVDEAMKLLLKHYQSQRNRPPYLLLLAKAAARAGDYQSAIGSYMRAYELAPKARTSAHPLFQAAFTSYQIQDYDGAARKFQQLVNAFPSSKLARDAKWHLAWMQYLRGNYSGAFESLNALAKAPQVTKKRRGRKIVVQADALTNDRVRYWSAMSLLRMGKTQEAVPLFQTLVRDPSIGFYSVAAYYRLTTISGAKLPPGAEIRLGLRKASDGPVALSEEELKAADEAVKAEQAEFESQEAIAAVAASAEGSDEASSETSSEAAESEAETEEDTVVENEADEGSSGFKDANLMARFERARDLALVGLEDAARRELMEIERKARRSDERRLLMSEYVQVENYYRSSYMGEVGFGAQRVRGGLIGESRQFWEFAYPKAWENAVLQSSKSTTVPEEFIWGIMRAESHFKDDASSAVGALGLMQLMPFTGRQVASLLKMNSFEIDSLLNPETNIRLGSRYLQRLLEKFSGSIPLAAAGYNAGPHRVHAWVRNFGSLDMDEFIEHIPYIETRNYVKKVVRNFQIYNLLYSSGQHPMTWLAKPVGVTVSEQIPTKEIW